MINDLDSISRPHFLVAVGVLINEQGEFLLASRPEGKSYAGFWEFPGGKIEVGEDAHTALVRELQEEMGITATQTKPWIEKNFDYPHAKVTLFFFHVTQWEGDIMACEQQSFLWQDPNNITADPILPANEPILRELVTFLAQPSQQAL